MLALNNISNTKNNRGTIAMPAFKVSQLMHKTYRRCIANFYRHFAIFYIPLAPANMTLPAYNF